MKIEIEIPKEFEVDYNENKFRDFFSRVLCDIEKGKCLCGNYEIETVEMFIKTFENSVIIKGSKFAEIIAEGVKNE